MSGKLLSTYLNDHLAGATAGRDLARRSLASNRGTPYAPSLERLTREIEEDRRELEAMMTRLGVGRDRLKIALAWAAEKAARLKPNAQLTGYSPLSRVLELESLSAGVQGKLALWRAIRDVAARDPRLGAFDLERLIRRAESQQEELEAQHRAAAGEAFAGADGRPA